MSDLDEQTPLGAPAAEPTFVPPNASAPTANFGGRAKRAAAIHARTITHWRLPGPDGADIGLTVGCMTQRASGSIRVKIAVAVRRPTDEENLNILQEVLKTNMADPQRHIELAFPSERGCPARKHAAIEALVARLPMTLLATLPNMPERILRLVWPKKSRRQELARQDHMEQRRKQRKATRARAMAQAPSGVPVVRLSKGSDVIELLTAINRAE